MISLGMVHGGAVLHVIKTTNAFGMMISACGRVIIPGDSDSRLCKTCVRITGYVRSVAQCEAQKLIESCTTDHRHINPDEWVARKYTPTQLGMFRDVISDWENGQDNDGCWIGTLALVVKDPKLTQDIKTAELTKRQGGHNPNAGLIDPNSKSVAKTTRKRGCGASEKQETLIHNLISQIREMNSAAADILDTIYTDAWINETKWADISAGIDALFAALNVEKRKAREIQREENRIDPAEDGFYVMGNTFVTVKWNRAKTGQYATVWDHEYESWEYDSRESARLVKMVKAGELARVTQEDAARFGELYGRCMRCSRTLTDPDSILESMGKVCRGKMGF